MNATRYLISTLFLACVCVPAAIFGAEDVPGLLEMKGPKAKEIVTKPSLFRESRLPHLPVSAKQYEFLVDRPRVALALAHLYAPFLDPYQVEVRPGRVFHIHEPGRLAGDAELIDARPGRRVYLISGFFDIFKIRINGQMVLMTVYREDLEKGEVFVDSTTSGSIKIASAFAGAFARAADFLFPRKVDQRIDRLLRAAASIAAAVRSDPAEAYRRLEASGEVSREELTDFVRMFGPES